MDCCDHIEIAIEYAIVSKRRIILPNGVAGFDGGYFRDVGHDIDRCKVDDMFQASVPVVSLQRMCTDS
jgi:hypothetical protein